VTPGLPLGPHPYNPFTLVMSPKLGLRQGTCCKGGMDAEEVAKDREERKSRAIKLLEKA
jgi:hypothetical protein